MLRWTLWFLFLFVLFMSLKPWSIDTGIEVNDKLGHALAYFALTFNCSLVFGSAKHLRIVLYLFLFGILIELLQGWIPGRERSGYDLLANLTGIMLGMGFLSIFGKRIRSLFSLAGITVKY